VPDDRGAAPAQAAEIRAVFFDIGNVLLRFDPKSAAAKIAWALRRHPLRVMRYLWDTKAVDGVERGTITPEHLYQRFQLELGFSGSYPAFKKLFCDHFTLLRPNFALLQKLSQTKKVYLLSNTNALHYDFIKERYQFPRLVHGAILSYELGLRKPEAAIYHAAVKLAGVPAPQCLFIDDLEENIKGAAKVGMRVILHTRKHDLRAAMAQLGLL
jgi:putative hydrolase of the HAD superfamily